MVVAFVFFLLVTQLVAQGRDARRVAVTSVAGESWLMHLGRSFDDTSMGKTERLGPPPEPGGVGEAAPNISNIRLAFSPVIAGKGVTLRGTDLYRLNCRGCHGESGLGAPPEINSVINPVRSSSTAAIMARMKAAGMEISRADAAKLAEQSHALLIDRLHHGGQDMPAFPHLDEAEIRSLVGYLKLLAEVPGAEREQTTVRESSLRVGEHIVKSTCHTCHSAAGSNPDAQHLADGAIPPLSTLPARVSEAQFVRKVTRGAPIIMGTPPQLCRGRMPVFYYLTEEEAADVYLYLTQYPPYRWAVADTVLATAPPASQQRLVTTDLDLAPTSIALSLASQTVTATTPPRPQDAGVKTIALISATGLFAAVFMVGGLGFTVRELRRLSAKGEVKTAPCAWASRKTSAESAHAAAAGAEVSGRVLS